MSWTIPLRAGAAALLVTVGTAAAIAAEPFPTGPIEVIVPTAAGGGTDLQTRALTALVEPILGQKIIVTNKPGANGTVGTIQVVRAKPDGYTLGSVWITPLAIAPHIDKVPYSPDDYTPISQAVSHSLVFCARPEFPANNGKEFIEELRKNPRKYTYGNDGVGGTVQLSGERIFRAVGVQAPRAVPFGGAGETLKAALGGHVDIYGGSIPPVAPHVKAGKLKCLLLTSAEKSDVLPDASTTADVGVPDTATVAWRGIIGPKGLPADRLEILEKAFSKAAQSAEFRAFETTEGGTAVGSTAKEFGDLIRRDYQTFETLVKELDLKKQ